MSNHSSRKRAQGYPWTHAQRHEHERWALTEAIKLGHGYAYTAGLNAEYVNGELAGYWKAMRCGCVFVCVLEAAA